MAGTVTKKQTLVSIDRLRLFKELQDELNTATFLGIHATADDALKLKTPVNIDGVSFDGSASITLPHHIDQVYELEVQDGQETVKKLFVENSTSSDEVVGIRTHVYYVVNTNRVKFFNGTNFVEITSTDDTPRIAVAEKGVANGVVPLNAQTLIDARFLPSYVDDVIEGYTATVDVGGVPTLKFYSDAGKTQEITGETGKIYVDLAATRDGQYRYSGSIFVPIGTSVSTADRAINDGNGDQIDTTYVKVEANKSLMTSDEHDQLATLVADAYTEITEAQIRALFEDEEPAGGGE